MASTSETGHAKNVSNFRTAIDFCISYGIKYNPIKDSIKISNLELLYTDSDKAVKQVNTTAPNFIQAVNLRQNAFKPLNKLCTRVLNALDASDVDPAIVKDARTIVDKIQGNRKSSSAPDPSDPDSKKISASQQSYDLRLDNFHKFKELLISQPLYAPNEVELQAATIENFYDNLESLNNAVKTALVPLKNIRNERNKILYNEPDGLVPIALEVKKYLKSVYGTSEPEFKQVNTINFKNLMDK